MKRKENECFQLNFNCTNEKTLRINLFTININAANSITKSNIFI